MSPTPVFNVASYNNRRLEIEVGGDLQGPPIHASVMYGDLGEE